VLCQLGDETGDIIPVLIRGHLETVFHAWLLADDVTHDVPISVGIQYAVVQRFNVVHKF
jgi:hypothetical protein